MDDRCYGCGKRDATFTDRRTNRDYCHECCSALISFEMDTTPDERAEDGMPYAEWLALPLDPKEMP